MSKTYFEYRGVDHLVYAEITADDATNYTAGTVKDLTGAAEIGKTVETANDVHWYDNIPAIIIEAEGSDTITINASGIPLDVIAEITGQYYDSAKGMLVEQERTPKYFALGYIANKTDGTEMLVWRLKGSFSTPGMTSAGKDAGTDANGQELTFTGISTTHKFAANGKPAKGVIVDTSINTTVTEATFFANVATPDTSF